MCALFLGGDNQILGWSECVNNALLRFLHNHGNIATEGSPKPGLCLTLISNAFKGSL